jgi:hypothetical protein
MIIGMIKTIRQKSDGKASSLREPSGTLQTASIA